VTQVRSFAPIAAPDATLLILGSMPGEESLRAGQYYAHPRNAFWRILGELVGARPELPYEQRVAIVKAYKIAIWDVLASCVRRGSLDADIAEASIEANDFRTFFEMHPAIARVFFNGATAQRCFRSYVVPTLAPRALHYQRLPSTSPAHAALRYGQKLAAWQVILDSPPGAQHAADVGMARVIRCG